MPKIVQNYNCNFTGVQGLQVTYKVAANHFKPICNHFNKKWHPQEMKNAFLSVFSLQPWKALSQEEKETHTQRMQSLQ